MAFKPKLASLVVRGCWARPVHPLSHDGILPLNQAQGELMTETIVAAFNSALAADAAVQDLERGRIPSAIVRSYTKENPDYVGYRAREPEHRGGFWSWLLGEEPTRTAEYGAYDTSLASGYTVVTVTVDEIHADAVVGIINQHGPSDIHEHAAEQSGVGQDYARSATDRADSSTMTDRAEYVAPGVSNSETGAGKDEEVIPLAEEELQVGKRIDRGATTIRPTLSAGPSKSKSRSVMRR